MSLLARNVITSCTLIVVNSILGVNELVIVVIGCKTAVLVLTSIAYGFFYTVGYSSLVSFRIGIILRATVGTLLPVVLVIGKIFSVLKVMRLGLGVSTVAAYVSMNASVVIILSPLSIFMSSLTARNVTVFVRADAPMSACIRLVISGIAVNIVSFYCNAVTY